MSNSTYTHTPITVTVSSKLRLATLLLAIFFGFLGVHRMYAGKVGTGIIMMLLSLSGIGIVASVIWLLIDLICIIAGAFRDADNLLITKWTN